MFERAVFILIFTAAIGSGLMAGIFFAFSSFVMAALGRILPEQGIAAMNAINVTVLNPTFLLLFLGTAVVCVAASVGSYPWWGETRGALILIASLSYIVGCFGVTMMFNVPLNDALAAVQPSTPEAGATWSHYLRSWTAWNHVRTVAPLLSAILFTAALP